MVKKKQRTFSHLDSSGGIRMVDSSSKKITERFAKASAFICLNRSTLADIRSSLLKKGDVLATAKIAGIMAAKKVDDLIPLTHSIPITHCDIQFNIVTGGIRIIAAVKTKAETGVEMEALTAVSMAALTIYDMVKSVERGAVIEKIQLEEKSGGKSGHYVRNRKR